MFSTHDAVIDRLVACVALLFQACTVYVVLDKNIGSRRGGTVQEILCTGKNTRHCHWAITVAA